MFFVELVIVVLAYLIGSFSTAVIVSGKLQMPDPRSYGSGNPGASNMLRSGRKDAAALTLLGDALKGMLAVLIALSLSNWLGLPPRVVAWSGIAVVVGHMWPLFFGFKGGKGVATALGVLLVLSPLTAMWCAAAWVVFAVKYKKSSLAAIVACVLAILFGFVYSQYLAQGWSIFVIALLVLYRHRSNVCRLCNGTEPDIAETAQPFQNSAAQSDAQQPQTQPENQTPAEQAAAETTESETADVSADSNTTDNSQTENNQDNGKS